MSMWEREKERDVKICLRERERDSVGKTEMKSYVWEMLESRWERERDRETWWIRQVCV